MKQYEELTEEELDYVNDIQAHIAKLDSYKKHTAQQKWNQYEIKSKQLPFSEEGVKEFNEIVEYVHTLRLNEIVRTESGGIATNNRARHYNCGAYDIRISSSRISLTILIGSKTWEFIMDIPDEDCVIKPQSVWKKFLKTLKEEVIWGAKGIKGV